MLDIFYTVLVYPIEFVMYTVVAISEPMLGYLGAIIVLSLLVNIILHPFKKWAIKLQNKERDIQYIMYPAVLETKQKYRGAEQFHRLKAIYAHHNYHPIQSIRGLMGLLIQIPFFVGAFFMLSNYMPNNAIIWGLDLTQPDGVLWGYNILPIIMTVMTIAIALFEGIEGWFERYGLALIFLILLYMMPSALVLYWTFNLIFATIISMVKSHMG